MSAGQSTKGLAKARQSIATIKQRITALRKKARKALKVVVAQGFEFSEMARALKEIDQELGVIRDALAEKAE